MSRTFLKQSSQIAKSDLYQDNLQPGLPLQEAAVTVQDDLNALRSMVKAATGASDWYAQPAESISGLNSRLSTAEGEIDTLQSDLTAETAARVSADSTLQSNIDSEASTRGAADLVLQGNIDAEASARASADLTLQGNIDSEASARTLADNTLQANIDAEASARAAADSAEASARSSADTLLQSNIDAEASARSSADTLLQSNIDAEASARAAADAAEASTRAAADTTLQNNIDSEASTRASADTLLQSNIDAEASARASADSLLTSSLNQEISDRQSADSLLQSNITSEANTRAAADLALQSNIDSEASTRAAADSALQTSIDNEVNARSSADTILQNNIDAEQAAREAADTTLQSNIDGKVAKAGDTMTGELVINPDNLLNALSITTAGHALSVADSVNGQFLLVDTSLQQMTFSDALGSGQVVVIDPAEVVVSHVDPQSNTQIAGTNVNAGQISLWMGGQPAMPASPEHVATKKYVDSLAVGLTLKAPVKAAGTLSAGALPSASSPVDGVTLAKGDRAFFFSADGSSSVNAGIWELEVTSAGGTSVSSWIRPSDYETGSDVSSTFFFVQQGQTYADTSWVEVADPAVVGTDALSFSQMFGPGAYLAGAGLDLVGNVFSVGQGEIVNSMIGDGEVSASKLASGSVETAKIADGAVANSKLADGAVDNSKISLNTITEDRLAFSVYTEAEVDAALALKLSLSGGTMTGALNMNYNQINLLAEPTAGADAATKSYVDSAVAGLDARASKTYSVVQVNQSAGTALFGGVNAPLDNALPVMPSEPATFASMFDVYLNGQLLRPGILVNSQMVDMDVNRDAINNQALVLTFDAKAGDVFCVVAYT